MRILHVPSPNHDERRAAIDMLVFHYTGMASGAAALERLCDPAAKVSAHYLVHEDGSIVQLVAEDRRAWHAGVGAWQGDSDLNSCSVGIEIVNGGHDFPLPDGGLPPYPDQQTEAVIALARDIAARHAIPASRFVGHSDIAPARKTDPGEHFPWARLAGAGIGLWPAAVPAAGLGPPLGPGASGPAVAGMQSALARIGYGIVPDGHYDEGTASVVRAFQRHWEPACVTGTATAATRARMAAIAALAAEL